MLTQVSDGVPGPRLAEQLGIGRRFVADPYATLVELHRQYGEIFALGLPPHRMVFAIGPHANRDVLATASGQLECRRAYRTLIPIGGDAALLLSDGCPHRARRRLLQPMFTRSRVEAMFGTFVEGADAMIDSWRPGHVVDIFAELRVCVVQIVAASLFGTSLSTAATHIRTLLDVMLAFANQWPWQQVRLTIPGTAWWRAERARRALDLIVYQAIDERRMNSGSADDLLTILVSDRMARTTLRRDSEVRDLVVSLLTAGFDTTSSALAWAVYEMLRTPGLWERVRDEVATTCGASPAAHGLRDTLNMNCVVAETLRMYPPAFLGLRKAMTSTEICGVRLAQGSTLAYSPYATHRSGEYWGDPDAFRPERWFATHSAQRVGPRWGYIPFGGGPRRCLGEQFALLAMKAVLARLVSRTRLRLTDQALLPTGLSAMHPRAGPHVLVDECRHS